MRIKEFEHKPFKPILSKQAIFVAGLPCEIVHIEEWFPSWTWLRWNQARQINHYSFYFITQALILFIFLKFFLIIIVINSFSPYLYHYIISSFTKIMI